MMSYTWNMPSIYDSIAADAVIVTKRALLAKHNAMAEELYSGDNSTFFLDWRQLGEGYVVAAMDYDGQKAGLAFCSPKDEFDLLEGIVRAVGRLRKGKQLATNPGLSDHPYISCSDLEETLYWAHARGILPTWAERAFLEECEDYEEGS